MYCTGLNKQTENSNTKLIHRNLPGTRSKKKNKTILGIFIDQSINCDKHIHVHTVSKQVAVKFILLHISLYLT